MKKIVVLSLVIIILAGIGVGVLYLINRNRSVFEEDVETTGAVLQAPPANELEAYTELYTLLAMGDIRQESFFIHSIPDERRIEITVTKPIDQNLSKVKTWMIQNNFTNIPPEKITYIEEK